LALRTAVQFCLVLLAWFALSFAHAYWLKLNLQPLPYDQAHHFMLALSYQPLLANPGNWFDVLSLAIYYPPLFHCSMAGLLFIQGQGLQMAPLINLAWLLLLMLSVWLIGRHSVGGWAGVAAAVLLALLPISAGFVREVLLEVCLAAMVAWSVYVLIRCDYLSKFRWTLALGACAGWGMLAKWSFALYFCPLFIWACWKGRTKRIMLDLKGLGGAVLIFLLITLPWYLHAPETLVRNMIGNISKRAVQEGDPSVFSLGSLLFYPASLVNDQIFLPLALLLGIGLIWGLTKARTRTMSLLIWFFGGLAILILLRNKDARYLYPLLPAACLLAMGWLFSIKRPFLRGAAVSSVLTLATAYFISTSYGIGPLAAETCWRYGGMRIKICGADNQYCRPPLRSDWKVPAIMNAVIRDWQGKDCPPKVGIMASRYFFHKSAFMATARYMNLPVRLESSIEPQNWPSANPESGLRNDLARLDYLVTKTGDLGQERDYKDAVAILERRGLEPGLKVAEFALPDGSQAVLWRLDKPVGDKVKAGEHGAE